MEKSSVQEFTLLLADTLQKAKECGIKITVTMNVDEPIKVTPPPPVVVEVPKIPISKDQYEVLLKDLEGFADVAKNIMTFYNIPTLANLPQAQFDKVRQRIYKIKKTYEEYERR